MTAVWKHSCDQGLQFLFPWSSAPPPLCLRGSSCSCSVAPLVQLPLPPPSAGCWLPTCAACLADPGNTSPWAPKQLALLSLVWRGLMTEASCNRPFHLHCSAGRYANLSFMLLDHPSPLNIGKTIQEKPFMGLTVQCEGSSVGVHLPHPTSAPTCSLRAAGHLVLYRINNRIKG